MFTQVVFNKLSTLGAELRTAGVGVGAGAALAGVGGVGGVGGVEAQHRSLYYSLSDFAVGGRCKVDISPI